jgi:death-on-curing protein
VDEPLWLSRQAIDIIHGEQLAEHGGRPGVRDENGLEAALARPRQHWAYGGYAALAELAAILCEAIVRGRPYIDGNKRTGFLAAFAFLSINGIDLNADEDQVVDVMDGLAAGRTAVAELAAWISRHARAEAG